MHIYLVGFKTPSVQLCLFKREIVQSFLFVCLVIGNKGNIFRNEIISTLTSSIQNSPKNMETKQANLSLNFSLSSEHFVEL